MYNNQQQQQQQQQYQQCPSPHDQHNHQNNFAPQMQPAYLPPPPMMAQNQMPPVVNQNTNLPRSANNCITPTSIQCPMCNQVSVTNVRTQAGSGTYTCCVILFLATAFCCFVPFCVDSCQDKVHTCARCGATVGTHEYKIC